MTKQEAQQWTSAVMSLVEMGIKPSTIRSRMVLDDDHHDDRVDPSPSNTVLLKTLLVQYTILPERTRCALVDLILDAYPDPIAVVVVEHYFTHNKPLPDVDATFQAEIVAKVFECMEKESGSRLFASLPFWIQGAWLRA